MLFIFEKSLRIWGWGKTHFKVRSQCSGTTCCDKLPPSWNSIPEDRGPKHWKNRSVQEGWCTTDNHRLDLLSTGKAADVHIWRGMFLSCPHTETGCHFTALDRAETRCCLMLKSCLQITCLHFSGWKFDLVSWRFQNSVSTKPMLFLTMTLTTSRKDAFYVWTERALQFKFKDNKTDTDNVGTSYSRHLFLSN